NIQPQSRVIPFYCATIFLAAAFLDFGSWPALANSKEVSARSVCAVRREIYLPSPQPRVSPVVRVDYLGGGLRLREFRCQQGKSDLTEKGVARYSEDNGETWSRFIVPDLGSGPEAQNGIFKEESPWSFQFDPGPHQTIEMIFQRVFLGEPAAVLKQYWKGDKKFFDHMSYRVSADDGRTWGERRQLAFEAGTAFDPRNWADPGYLRSNEMYGSY